MRKQLIWTEGIITSLGPVEILNRPDKEPVEKQNITIETECGQKGFFEARKHVISFIKKNKIVIGTKVNYGFVLIGSEKNGKCYNNLFINEIEHAN